MNGNGKSNIDHFISNNAVETILLSDGDDDDEPINLNDNEIISILNDEPSDDDQPVPIPVPIFLNAAQSLQAGPPPEPQPIVEATSANLNVPNGNGKIDKNETDVDINIINPEETNGNHQQSQNPLRLLEIDLFDVSSSDSDIQRGNTTSDDSSSTTCSSDYEEIEIEDGVDPYTLSSDDFTDSDNSDDYHEQRVAKLKSYLKEDVYSHYDSHDSEEEDLLETLFEDKNIYQRLLPSMREMGIPIDPALLKTKKPERKTGPEVITLDDGKEDAVDESNMVCHRCPPRSSRFHKKTTFLIHRRRHFAPNHYACPHCRKGFVKLSFCLAHEFKVHEETDENLNSNDHSKLMLKLMKFTQHAKEDAETSGPGTSVDKTEVIRPAESLSFFQQDEDSNPKPGEKRERDTLGNKIEVNLNPGQDDFIYKEYAVPSTGLFPYRGPPINKRLEAYETQLRHGTYRKGGLNTTYAQLIIARRKEMVANRVMPEREDGWEEWHKEKMARMKIENPEAYEAYMKSSSISKRRTTINVFERERKKISEDTCFLCNYCGFYASRKESIVRHHRKRHADRSYNEVVKKVSLNALKETCEMKHSGMKKTKYKEAPSVKPSSSLKPSVLSKVNLPPPVYYPKRHDKSPPWKSYYHYTFRTPDRPPSPDRSTKVGFLSALGLIEKDKVKEFSQPKCPKMRPVKLQLHSLSTKQLGKRRHFKVCNMCNFFALDKETVNEHKKEKHSVEILTQFATQVFGEFMRARREGEL